MLHGKAKDLLEGDDPRIGSDKIQEEQDYNNLENGSIHTEKTGDLQAGTKRGLSARHVQLIALGGTIGYYTLNRINSRQCTESAYVYCRTGLFLNSGTNIATVINDRIISCKMAKILMFIAY